MGAREVQQALWAGLGHRQAGDEVGDLVDVLPPISRDRSMRDLGGARPFEMGTTSALTATAGLDPAMALFERLGAAESGGGPAARPVSAEGGKIAEALGDGGVQLGLVGLDANR